MRRGIIILILVGGLTAADAGAAGRNRCHAVARRQPRRRDHRLHGAGVVAGAADAAVEG